MCVCVWLQVEEELWEEDFIERCVQELLEEEEQWEWFIPSRDLPSQTVSQLQEQISLLVLDQDVHKDADFDIVVSPHQPVRSWSAGWTSSLKLYWLYLLHKYNQ